MSSKREHVELLPLTACGQKKGKCNCPQGFSTAATGHSGPEFKN